MTERDRQARRIGTATAPRRGVRRAPSARSAFVWSADALLIEALMQSLGESGRRLVVASPPGASRLPRAGAAIDIAVIDSAASVSGFAGNDAVDVAGARLRSAFALARQLAARATALRVLLLLAADDGDGVERDLVRAGVVTMAHGLAKALPRRVRVGAVLAGPVEEARRSGERRGARVAAADAASFVTRLALEPRWATGSVFHLAGARR